MGLTNGKEAEVAAGIGSTRKTWLGIAAAGVLLWGSPPVPAFAWPSEAPRSPATSDQDDMREALQLMMISSMKKALELTREQEREVVPKVQQVFEERERYAAKRREALLALREKL